jgi:N6-adenosine-specific RNA methylase IME4
MQSSQSLPPGDRLLRGLPLKHFPCVHADVPWHYKPYKPPPPDAHGRRDTERHYSTMSVDEIAALPVADYVARDCHLWFWSTGTHLPMAFEIMRGWGFKFSASGFVWIKLKKKFGQREHLIRSYSIEEALHLGLGKTTRKNAEFCLLGRRGNPKKLSNSVREVILTPVREHSRKPDEVYERIEKYCPGPRLDLFGRQQRPGWEVRGDEADKFGVEA